MLSDVVLKVLSLSAEVIGWLWLFFSRQRDKLQKQETRLRSQNFSFLPEERTAAEVQWWNPLVIWRNLPEIGRAIVIGLYIGLLEIVYFFKQIKSRK